MAEVKNNLLKNYEILGVTKEGYHLLLFHPGQASDLLLYSLQKLSDEAFKHDGHQLKEQSEIDHFNRIYSHLILWNISENVLIGWQRFTKTEPIIKQHGISGLYSSTLFNFTENIQEKLRFGFEMGRNFIHPAYRRTLALAYLWSGILKYIFNEGDIKYIYGLMSIGGHYPSIVKAYIVYLYTLYFGQLINLHVVPNNHYTIPNRELSEIKTYIKGLEYKNDLSQLIEKLKNYQCELPVFVKHCMNFCERDGTQLLAVGVDHDFGSCIDLFSIAEVEKIKPININGYRKLIA